MREEDLIKLAETYFAPEDAARISLLKDIGDDCAVLKFNKLHDLLITCDTLTEGTHFTKGTAPELLAHKLLAVNLSDVAAMGGTPWIAVLSLAAPKNISKKFAEAFFGALGKEAQSYGLKIVGGDCVASPNLTLTLTLLGKVKRGEAIYRSGAREGDLVLVTGRLGGTFKSGKHLSFQPRLKEARYLSERLTPSAMMDLSDGLLEDGRKLAVASRLTMSLESSLIPCNSCCDLKEAVTGGEDFELLLTVPKEKWSERVKNNFKKKFQLEINVIGKMEKRGKAALLIDGRKQSWSGYAHFGI